LKTSSDLEARVVGYSMWRAKAGKKSQAFRRMESQRKVWLQKQWREE
jgi:hypothetical protein